METLKPSDVFEPRHNSNGGHHMKAMLEACGYETMDALIRDTVPASIVRTPAMKLPVFDTPLTESQFLAHMRELANTNKVAKNFLGTGYYGTVTPSVILRNLFENPGWYTQVRSVYIYVHLFLEGDLVRVRVRVTRSISGDQSPSRSAPPPPPPPPPPTHPSDLVTPPLLQYTPYQAEIAQGRLESLLNFQSMVTDLTGMPMSNASLLDEATAAAEAMTMCSAIARGKKTTFYVSDKCHPQTIAVCQSRADGLGLKAVVGPVESFDLANKDACGVLVQYPNTEGTIVDYKKFTEEAHAGGLKVCVSTDLLALTIMEPPSTFGADIVIGSSQRFGVPMGYGGPHAAFLATSEEYKRMMPGRIIGVTRDADGAMALRMAMQTREQHIRRDKATSNICTAQALLANAAAMYAIYHGPEGLKKIAQRCHGLACTFAEGVTQVGG